MFHKGDNCSAFGFEPIQLVSSLDLAELVFLRDVDAAQCTQDDGYCAGITPSTKKLSLSAMANKFLGFPIDKALRMTNWERRPLRPSQLHYGKSSSLL